MKEEVNIDILVNNVKAAKSVGDMKRAFKDLEAATDSANQAIDNTTNGAKTLKQQLREMTLELQGLEPGTARFNELNEAAGRLKDQIADTNAAINATAGAPLENLGKGLGSMTKIGLNGFQGIQGAMQAFGNEGKALQEGMAKLQGVMAMTEAIENFGALGDQITNMKAAFGSFTKAAIGGLQGIKGAIAATGIGLLIIALGTLYAYWDDIKAAVNGVSKEQQKLNEEAAANLRIQQAKLDSISGQENILKLQGKSERQILQMKIKQTGEVIKATEQQMEQNRATTKAQVEAAQRNKDILKGIIEFIEAPLMTILRAVDKIAEFAGYDTDLAEGFKDWTAELLFDPEGIKKEGDKAYYEQKKALQKLKNDQAGYELEIQAMDKEAADNRLEKAKENAEKLAELKKEIADNDIKLTQQIEDQKAELLATDEERELEKLRLSNERALKEIKDTKATQAIKDAALLEQVKLYEQQKKDIEDKFRKERKDAQDKADKERIDKEDADWLAYQEATLSKEDFEILQAQQKYDALFEAANGNAEKEKALEIALREELAAIKKEYREKAEADAKDAAEKEIAALQAVAEQKAAIEQQGLDTALQAVSLIRGVFEKQKGVQRAGVIAESAIGIAKMVIANKLANIGALATPQAIATSGAAAAPVIAMNNISTALGIAANIAATAKALKELGGGSAPGAPALGGGGAGAGTTSAQAGSFTPSTFYSLGQGSQNTSNGNNSQSVVYVGDINKVQNKVQVIENRAVLGQ